MRRFNLCVLVWVLRLAFSPSFPTEIAVRKRNLFALAPSSRMNQQAKGEAKRDNKLVPIISNSKSSGHHKNSNKKFAFGKHMFFFSFLPFLLLRSLIAVSDVLGGATVFLFSHLKSHSEIA